MGNEKTKNQRMTEQTVTEDWGSMTTVVEPQEFVRNSHTKTKSLKSNRQGRWILPEGGLCTDRLWEWKKPSNEFTVQEHSEKNW